MSYRHPESIDLLEIYHARRLRSLIAQQLRRLAQDEASAATVLDAERRQEIREHYTALLIGADELLRNLGDVATPHYPV
jgi:hypothetical protein